MSVHHRFIDTAVYTLMHHPIHYYWSLWWCLVGLYGNIIMHVQL